MISLLPKNGATVDALDWWFRFTLDSSTEFLFGQSVDSLVNPKVIYFPNANPPSLTVGRICRRICTYPKSSGGEIPNGASLEDLSS